MIFGWIPFVALHFIWGSNKGKSTIKVNEIGNKKNFSSSLISDWPKYILGVFAFGVTYYIGRFQTGILLQLLVAYTAYWIGDRVIKSKFEPSSSKNKARRKRILILSAVGLLGLLSPIVGFIFALPAFLIAKNLLTNGYNEKNKLMYISGGAVLICLGNAAWGAYL